MWSSPGWDRDFRVSWGGGLFTSPVTPWVARRPLENNDIQDTISQIPDVSWWLLTSTEVVEGFCQAWLWHSQIANNSLVTWLISFSSMLPWHVVQRLCANSFSKDGTLHARHPDRADGHRYLATDLANCSHPNQILVIITNRKGYLPLTGLHHWSPECVAADDLRSTFRASRSWEPLVPELRIFNSNKFRLLQTPSSLTIKTMNYLWRRNQRSLSWYWQH